MNILFQYLILFLQIYVVTVFISGCGFLLKKYIFNYEDKYSFENNSLWGFILISFIALGLNFIIPLNSFNNSLIIFFLSLIIFWKKYFHQPIKKFFKKSIIVTLLAFILIIHSNVNNPDALLYHLPYSKIINEYKILIGSFNIHHRFGHISIIQYLNSFFNLFFFNEKGLLLPLSILVSSFFIYLLKEFKLLFKSNVSRINSLVIFCILIVSLYSFSRYSNYGNDAPVHIYYYLIIVYIFKYNFEFSNNLLLKQISLLSLFTFLIKPFYLISLFIPLIFLILNKNFKYFFKSIFFLFSCTFSFLWFLKNFLISSCLIYPIKISCFENLIWSNPTQVIKEKLQGEVMSKSWQDRLDTNISMTEYNQNFEWLSTWSNNHLNVVIEKFFPIIIFLALFSFILFCLKLFKIRKLIHKNNLGSFIIFITSLFGSIIWFLNFPIYRYGQSYLFITILFLIYFFIFQNLDEFKIFKYKKFLNIVIILAFIGLGAKNFNRINEKFSDTITPYMYDDIVHSNISKKFINNFNEFTHYYKEGGGLCGYSISPCSENKDKNLRFKTKFGYRIYYINKS